MQQVHRANNSAALGSLAVGAIAFCLSLVGLMPGSHLVYYSAGGVLAIIGGARALARRRRGYGTILWAPVLAITLGALAAVFMVSEIAVSTIARDADNAATTGSPAQLSGTISTPPSFATDPTLTAYESSAASIAARVYATYSGGQLETPGSGWPASVTVGADGTVTIADGLSAGTLPAGEALAYIRSNDGRGFDVLVSGSNHLETAIYDSATNSFHWSCTSSDTGCPPGALVPPSSGSSGSNA
jgi:hypothetical protein